jgi:shikimate kinase
MNVVLIGYRGTGKSTVGKILAARLGRIVISTDAEIVKRAGQSIPEIVAQHGWDYFRDLESQVCGDLAGQDGLVIDTGGGAILRSENVERLKQSGRLFWLTASVESITQRIGRDTQRPSLTGTKSFVEEVEEVLRERTPKYRAAADHIIATDGRSIVQIADEILARL